MIDIFFIRHAESMGNVNHHLIGGQSNHLPLSNRGVQQCMLLGKRFQEEEISFQQIHSSVAVRARETARIVSEMLGYPLSYVQSSPLLLELSQGEWEGQVRKEIFTESVLEEIRTNPWDFAAPGGESPRQVEERMFEWLKKTLVNRENQDLRIGVFSHGMAIKCFLRGLLDADPGRTYYYTIYNTSITRIQFDSNDWWLERMNDHAHLQGTEFIGNY